MKTNTFLSSLVKYYFVLPDIYDNIDLKKVKVNRKALKLKYGKGYNIRAICCKMFVYFLYLIILDIIRNNITFIFPLKKTMVLGIKKFKNEKVIEYLTSTKSQMYDIFGAGFVLPRITLFYEYMNKEIRTKEVVLNYSLTKEFFDNINSGKVYG